MRISTANAYDATVDMLQQRQRELSDSQLKLTSGKRVERASDDPINAARAERALAEVERNTASLRSVDASRSASSQAESALTDAGELLQQVREALVASGNTAYDDTQLKVLSDQIRGLRNQLLSVANRGDGADGFLFGGQGSSSPPFIDAPGGVTFSGTRGQTRANRNEALPLTMDGEAIWLSAPTGNGVFDVTSLGSSGSAWIDTGAVDNPAAITGSNYTLNFTVAPGVTTYSVLENGSATALTKVTYTSGQAIQIDGMAVTVTGQPADGDTFDITPSTPSLSVFDTLDKAINDLATPALADTQITQATVKNLRNVDAVLSRMLAARASAGEALNHLDNVTDRLDAASLAAQTERSIAEDLDMISAISDFQNKQSGYQAALQTYASVQQLSLFDYIRT